MNIRLQLEFRHSCDEMLTRESGRTEPIGAMILTDSKRTCESEILAYKQLIDCARHLEGVSLPCATW